MPSENYNKAIKGELKFEKYYSSVPSSETS